LQNGLEYEGSDPIDVDKSGNQIIDKSNPNEKIFSKEYIRIMKILENKLLEEKKVMLIDQNKEYYQ
jgi:hypothetical protein